MKKDVSRSEKWYFKTSTLITALICVGPLAIPLLWFNPRYRLRTKILLTVILFVLTYYIGVWLRKSITSLSEYYKQAF